MDVLNALFSSIDFAAKCIGNVWKVETIGDCYIGVVGPLCVCVCVCVYIHIHTYIQKYIYTYIHTSTYIGEWYVGVVGGPNGCNDHADRAIMLAASIHEIVNRL